MVEGNTSGMYDEEELADEDSASPTYVQGDENTDTTEDIEREKEQDSDW